jgi:hypothetical protein
MSSDANDAVRMARNLGLSHGWQHAAHVDTYGDDGRPLDEVKAGMRSGLVSDAESAAYDEGFDEGMCDFSESADDDETDD